VPDMVDISSGASLDANVEILRIPPRTCHCPVTLWKNFADFSIPKTRERKKTKIGAGLFFKKVQCGNNSEDIVGTYKPALWEP